MIPYGRQDINQQDIDAVVAVLKSDWLTQGPRVPAFEQAIADYTGSACAVAANSATSALHIACLALGVGPGDSVWTSPITFVASANCALYCGADIDFVDVNSETGNMCPHALAEKLASAKQLGKLPKVVIPVHLCGHSCDMQSINTLAKEYGFKVIEDASHGIGGSYKGAKVGSCQYSDITVFSFHPVKVITSAEGGVATTNDVKLAQKMRHFSSHGVIKDPDSLLRPDEGGWYYEQHELGYNYRMTELQGALGLSQLSRLDSFVAQRNLLAKQYDAAFAALPLQAVQPLPESYSARHLYMVKLDKPQQRKVMFDYLRGEGVQVHVHYYPVHLQPFYMAKGFMPGALPAAEAFYRKILTLPLFPTMNETQQHEVIAKVVHAAAI